MGGAEASGMSAPKKLSLRAQARLKRENRELRERLNDIINGSYPGTVVSRITLDSTVAAEIRTANRLGFSLVVRDSGGVLAFHAVRREI